MKQKLALFAALGGAGLLGALAVAYSNAGSNPAAQAAKPAVASPAPQTTVVKPSTAAFSASQETAIREIVRAYLIEHPEVLADAARAYDEKQARLQEEAGKTGVRANLAELLSDEDGYRAGKDLSKAKVAVIEFFDYHCGFCKKSVPLVRELMKSDPAVKFVFRELPILREESEFAAEAALAARAQGKYPNLHFAMMEASGALTKERIFDIAKKEGLDVARLEADMKSPAVKKALDETQRIAREMRVDGTPAFIVTTLDGSYVEVVPGLPRDGLKDAIAKAKKAAGVR